jgi:hypothetical protein
MHSWEFHHQGGLGIERWSWRALHRDGSLHTASRQYFDSFTKAFENAKSHGLDPDEHKWHLASPRDESVEAQPGQAPVDVTPADHARPA